MRRIKDELGLFQKIMRGMAAEFGHRCEIVLHDYEEEYDHTIVAIENGHVTGRRVGDPGTNLGLEVLRGINRDGDQYNYKTQTSDGKILRSTSVYIKDDEGKAIGALCMNWDVTEFIMLEHMIHDMANGGDNEAVKEIITDNVSDILEGLIQDSINYVGKPVARMSRDDKVMGLRYLDEKGAFLIKRAADRVAKYYDISKNTLYNYLE